MPPDLPLNEMRAGLTLLLQAFELARDAECEISEFAVEIQRLHQAGLTVDHLRWMIAKGYGRHLVEVTEDGNDKRVFHPAKSRFHRHSCVILTGTGVKLARSVRGKSPEDLPEKKAPRTRNRPVKPAKRPKWDPQVRRLTFDGDTVKEFRRSASDQIPVLTAFEDCGWVEQIQAPACLLSGKNIKTRVHNTINALNSRQLVRRIQFSADGSGLGIKWAPLPRPLQRPQLVRRKRKKAA